MVVIRRAQGLLVAASLFLAPGGATAQGNCTVVDVDFTPAANSQNPSAPQIVAWIEDTSGNYLDTIYITQLTGTFGIGNRPGRFDFNSGPNWPYGRRPTVFPVWSHRHGLSWDEVVFQNADESNLSHPFNNSSREAHFCRPLMPTEEAWDAVTCASQAYTDKGVLKPGGNKSFYPPRNDVARATPDDPSVDMYDVLNPFDAVSQATPPAGTPATISWPVPETLPFGDYVLFVEVSREFDMNASYNETVFAPPDGIPWAEYGLPYRGQPSVVYKMPFALNAASTTALVSDYLGYGDPDGVDGNVRAPDDTITTNVPGSGAARLQLVSRDNSTYRVRLVSKPQVDFDPPAGPGALQLVTSTSRDATIGFVAPGDDGTVGKVTKYEIRMLAGQDMTAETFETGTLVTTPVVPVIAGTPQSFRLDGLLPETDYSVGIRAFDDCRNTGEVSVLSFTTAPRDVGDVDACFIATAAYGSVMASDVELLRHFRDSLLRKTVLGELAVETYYTFGPAVSGVVGESDLLRATAREVLRPIVRRVRGFQL
ncbi:MAG: Fibronectin type domain protein [Deltaproteobacteria bacterium]|nr:Fibronectin type domain protein [Deltaproteobacteria bacterium]